MHKALFSALALLATTTQVTLPSSAEAAIYKCQDAQGGISYTHAPCPVTQQTSKVLKASGKSNNAADCRIANNFALDVATKMREGRSADDTFLEYGGINSLKPTTISIINYVYTHRLNISTVPARIAQLSAARCDASAYGNPQCDQFPLIYINEVGGCDKAAGGEGTVSATAELLKENARQSDRDPATIANSNLTAVRSAPPVPNATTGMTYQECKAHYETRMASVRESMRARLSADQQNQKREEYQSLRKAKNNC